MKHRKEDFIKGAVFYFYNKTPKGKLLFRERDDYLYFLNKFQKNLMKYPCEVYSYCLMPNHFHFCLEQNGEQPLYRLFNDTLTSYALHYNSKYHLRGKLLQDRLQNKIILKDDYLIQVCKYIHHNPVKALLVEKVEDWEFSNYREYIHLRKSVMFSKKLVKMYPDDFDDYSKNLSEYEKYQDELKLESLLFD